MHQPTLQALEFPRIQQELAGHCASKLGVALALAAGPCPSLEQARAVQEETTEARALLDAGRTIPFGGVQDVRTPVERAALGGVLTVEQLLAVADTIYGCRILHRFLTEQASAAPRLGRYAERFGRFDRIEEEINRCIERGGVSSRASRALKEIRREIATLEGRIQDRLNSLLRQVRSHLQEALVTTRNGRYVVPVKASARAAVPGTVHGASGSGATLFIEPDAIRQLSAELESWRAMEEAEVEQILATLSGLVAEQSDQLLATLDAVAQLDLIIARGRLSQAWGATPVRWNEEGRVDLIGARHPLLGRRAIGNRIRLNREQRMLIVTGPNTGGKTLLLKTLGIIVAIAQSGLHIPAEAGSTLCFFDQFFADIGDQQSLEQSLSTFSGHIANVAPMLAAAGPGTLVLLDELGSGTDPHEGTGLGIAMLEAFLAKGAYALATTHLRDIKEFGRLNPQCEIAGMGFDGESLQPTYRLIYGTLGESHGLEIAGRAGLPVAVVQRARELLYGEGGTRPGASVAGAAVVALPAAGGAPPAVKSAPAAHTAATATGTSIVTVDTAGTGADTGSATGTTPVPAAATGSRPPSADPGVLVVAPVSPRRCRIWTGEEEREIAIADGLRRQYPDGLLPGDRAIVREGLVVGLKPRSNTAAWRDADNMKETPLAANLSRLLILLSARQPDFHAGVLARHLLYAEYHGVEPVIVLTKVDRALKGEAERWLAPFRAVGYRAVEANLRGDVADVRQLLGEGVPAILANPGAGKSTLCARLGAVEPTRVRRQPPSAETVRLPEVGWAIDLPSLRELGMWKPDLAVGFRAFLPYAGQCAQPGCLHGAERDCAVRAAVESGSLAAGGYRRYRQLVRAMGLGG